MTDIRNPEQLLDMLESDRRKLVELREFWAEGSIGRAVFNIEETVKAAGPAGRGSLSSDLIGIEGGMEALRLRLQLMIVDLESVIRRAESVQADLKSRLNSRRP